MRWVLPAIGAVLMFTALQPLEAVLQLAAALATSLGPTEVHDHAFGFGEPDNRHRGGVPPKTDLYSLKIDDSSIPCLLGVPNAISHCEFYLEYLEKRLAWAKFLPPDEGREVQVEHAESEIEYARYTLTYLKQHPEK